jgi:hypothetical protein
MAKSRGITKQVVSSSDINDFYSGSNLDCHTNVQCIFLSVYYFVLCMAVLGVPAEADNSY